MRRFVLPFVLGWANAAHAGAWLMPEGDGLAITQLTYFSSDHYWDAEGNAQPQDTYRKWEIQPYAEYGLTKNITLGGTAYLQQDTQSGATNRGIADPEIFLRRKLWQDARTIVSLQPLIKLPSYFQNNDEVPRGGSKSTDAELSLLYGRNVHLFSDRDYADFRLGYRLRNQGLNPQFKADAAFGVTPFDNWQFIPALRYVKAQEISDTAFAQTGDLDYDLFKAELAIAYQFTDGNWVQGTYFKHVDGRQTGDGSGFILGYAKRF